MASIQGVYVALFGRPADPTGLAYFNSITSNGQNLSNISNLSGTKEYQDRFAGQNNVQIVTAIYQSLFGRAPEAAGLNFFVDALNKGTLTINNVAINILDGAKGSDKTIVDNKIAAADLFTKALDTPVEIGSYVGNAAAAQGRAFLSGVTTTVPSQAAVDAQINVIVATPPGSTGTPGVAISLTEGNDTVSTAQANASFKATAGDDTINGSATFTGKGATLASTLNSGDNIDGDAGTDTLVFKVTGAAAGTTANTAGGDGTISVTPTLSNVEKIFVTSVGGAANATGGVGGASAVTFDLDKATGVKEVWSEASTAGAAATNAGGASSVTFKNIALGTTLGVKGATDSTQFDFKTSAVAGNSDSATINLQGSTGAIRVDAIETLNLAVSGNSTVTSLTDSTLDKIVATGTGTLNLTTASSTLKSVDASALNSALTLSTSASATGVAVTGTKFADSITLRSNAANADDKDTIVYNAGNKSTVGAIDDIKNLEWKVGSTVEDKIDVKAFAMAASTGVTTFTVASGANPSEGQSFLGNKVAIDTVNNVIFFETSGDGKFNAAEDLAIHVNTLTGFTTDNVIWA